MGLRKDFLIHKRRTIESFRFARADITAINVNVEQLKNTLSSVESGISNIGSEISNLKNALDKCSSDINLQQISSLNVISKIDSINKSIGNAADAIEPRKEASLQRGRQLNNDFLNWLKEKSMEMGLLFGDRDIFF